MHDFVISVQRSPPVLLCIMHAVHLQLRTSLRTRREREAHERLSLWTIGRL